MKADPGVIFREVTVEEKKGSFIRWQSITIAQLTYAVHLILSFSVAGVAFQVAVLLDNDFTPVSWHKCAFLASLLALLASAALGVWCVINRLHDFRVTTKVARMREQNTANCEMEFYRVLSEKLGRTTWRIFFWEIGMFCAGIVLLILGISGPLSAKLL